MKWLLKIGVTAICATAVAGCGSSSDAAGTAPAPKMNIIESGNPQFDAFQAHLVARDAKAIAAEVDEFGSISGLPMPFTDATTYLAFVKDCSLSRVVVPTNRFMKGRFELEWTCPNGNFKQSVDTVSRAPKITLSELY